MIVFESAAAPRVHESPFRDVATFARSEAGQATAPPNIASAMAR